MFFKMVKNDLKQKKALNVVLFLFMIAASVLVLLSSVQLYTILTEVSRNREVCKMSELLMFTPVQGSEQNSIREYSQEILSQNKDILDYYSREILSVNWDQVDFDQLQETEIDELKYYTYYLMKQPKDHDLLFDTQDRPFHVENNTLWLPEKFHSLYGLEVGHPLQLISDMGKVYRMQVGGFYKMPYSGFNYWYLLSDADYDYLSGECFRTVDMYGAHLSSVDYGVYLELSDSMSKKGFADINIQDLQNSNEHILSLSLAAFLAIICVFFILIILMTIRFTMAAALKEEEREIGMIRAIGADSLRFRWLFAAKYIAFAVIGGAIGLAIGFPLTKPVLMIFGANNIFPSDGEIFIIGVLSILLIVAAIIGFSMLVMRRIRKVSIITALRGDDPGERFGRGIAIQLHKRKIMSPALFLAFSDILRRFKRYVFLLIAYILGITIILLAVNVKNSVISTDFLKYGHIYQMDFFPHFTDQQIKNYSKRIASENKGLWELFNEDIQKAGIPAHADCQHYMATGTVRKEGLEQDIITTVYYGSGDISRLAYREGTVPVKEDEVALSWFSASNLGIRLGDEISLKLSVYSNEEMREITKESKCTVTAFLNEMDNGSLVAVMGTEYTVTGTTVGLSTCFAMIIDAEEQEKEKVFHQLEKLFGENVIITGLDYLKINMPEYDLLFTLLENAISLVVIMILVLITYLYSGIFIAEEKSEIALQKSLGFTEGSIRHSHILRILILAVVSVLLSELLLHTGGQAFVGLVMESLGITGFTFLSEWLYSLCVIPCIVIAVVVLTQWLSLRQIRRIAIWNVRDE